MYTVYCDEKPIYDLRNEELVLGSPKLTLEESNTGSFQFTILPTHPYYDDVIDLVSNIVVKQDGEEIFSGIPTEHTEDFYKRRTFYCTGELSYLKNTTQPMAEYHDVTVRGFLEALLNIHNAKVVEKNKFYVGEVTVKDNNDSLYRYTNYETTLECINEKLIKKLGGHIKIRKENGKRYIDYIEDYAKVSNQIIQFGENLMDFTKDYDTSDICTVLIPLGARQDESPISALDAYLDITSVNDGKNYIVNQEAVNKYGWIEKVVKWDDVNVPTILKTKGEKYLKEVQYEPQTLEIKAIDLHNLNINTDAIRVLDSVRVVSKPHNLDKFFLVTKRQIPLNKPSDEVFTFGAKIRESLTDTTQKENADVKNKLNSIPNKSEILDEARKNATQIIHDATHGHVVTTANEQLIMDTDDVKTAKNLWRWNLGGLAHSSNGYDGAYDTAITMDGQIVGERIIANSIDASKLSINYKQSVEKKITVSLDDSKKYADEKATGAKEYTDGQVTEAKDYANTQASNAESKANEATDKKLQSYWTSVETQTKIENSAEKVIISASEKATQIANEALTNAKNYTDNKLVDYVTSAKLEVEKNQISLNAQEYAMACANSSLSSANGYTNSQLKEYVTSADLKVKTDAIEASVSKKVGNDEWSTKLKQSATDIQFAWNSCSDYIKFIDGEMKVYESSTNTDDTLLASFYKRGITLYKDGSRLGMIGTNNIIGNESVKGIVFDLNYSGSYMAWASKDVNDDVNEYTIKLAYVGKGRGFENHEEDALYSTVTLDMRNHYLKNPIFKIGDDIGKNLTFNFYQCTSVTDHKGNFPTTPCYLRFKHGLMVDAKVFQIT
jgi:hypothetical protein